MLVSNTAKTVATNYPWTSKLDIEFQRQFLFVLYICEVCTELQATLFHFSIWLERRAFASIGLSRSEDQITIIKFWEPVISCWIAFAATINMNPPICNINKLSFIILNIHSIFSSFIPYLYEPTTCLLPPKLSPESIIITNH